MQSLVEKLQKNLDIVKEQSKQLAGEENGNGNKTITTPTVWQLGSMETKGNRIDALIADSRFIKNYFKNNRPL